MTSDAAMARSSLREGLEGGCLTPLIVPVIERGPALQQKSEKCADEGVVRKLFLTGLGWPPSHRVRTMAGKPMRKMEVLLLLSTSSSRNSFFEIASVCAELSYQSTFARIQYTIVHPAYKKVSR